MKNPYEALKGRDEREQYMELVAIYLGVKELSGYAANMAGYYYDCGIPACTCAVNLLDSLTEKP